MTSDFLTPLLDPRRDYKKVLYNVNKQRGVWGDTHTDNNRRASHILHLVCGIPSKLQTHRGCDFDWDRPPTLLQGV